MLVYKTLTCVINMENSRIYGYGYVYEYGKSLTFSIGYGDEYGNVHIRPVPITITIPTI